MMQPAALPSAIEPGACRSSPYRPRQAGACLAAQSVTCAVAVSVLATLVLLASLPVRAFDKLLPAQALIYETPHLANTRQGDELAYRYTGQGVGATPVSDIATLDVTAAHDDGRRDVQVDFLSDERHVPLPDFDGWRGNPILLAMFEHVAQDMSAETGGGALYFRNRIRDAMASNEATLEQIDTDWQGRSIEVTRLRFEPFRNDAYLGARPEYAATEFALMLSDAVPGGVLSVQVEARDGDTVLHQRTLQLDGTTP